MPEKCRIILKLAKFTLFVAFLFTHEIALSAFSVDKQKQAKFNNDSATPLKYVRI
jgi:hypothetical protein